MKDYFNDLPTTSRPDMTPFLIHLTKSNEETSAFDNLVNILKSGLIKTTDGTGFIKGGCRAACFMEVPISALKYSLTKENKKRYEPYGIFCSIPYSYYAGARPVLYLSNNEAQHMIPEEEMWRVVRFEIQESGYFTDWRFEREWRCPTDFQLSLENTGVLVKNIPDAQRLTKLLSEKPDDFKIVPNSILPLSVVLSTTWKNY